MIISNRLGSSAIRSSRFAERRGCFSGCLFLFYVVFSWRGSVSFLLVPHDSVSLLLLLLWPFGDDVRRRGGKSPCLLLFASCYLPLSSPQLFYFILFRQLEADRSWACTLIRALFGSSFRSSFLLFTPTSIVFSFSFFTLLPLVLV